MLLFKILYYQNLTKSFELYIDKVYFLPANLFTSGIISAELVICMVGEMEIFNQGLLNTL